MRNYDRIGVWFLVAFVAFPAGLFIWSYLMEIYLHLPKINAMLAVGVVMVAVPGLIGMRSVIRDVGWRQFMRGAGFVLALMSFALGSVAIIIGTLMIVEPMR